MSSAEIHSELPAMPITDPVVWEGIEVSGLVSRNLSLSLEDVSGLSKSNTVRDFRCHDGWVAPAQR